MNRQQKEIQQQYLNNEKAVLKQLEKNYQDALDEINSKIEILLARQDADMQHVIYQVEYQKAMKTQVQAILENLQANEFETVSEYLAKSYEDGFIGTMYDLQGQGIPLVFPIDQEQVVAAIQHETKLSENLYTALGKDINELKKNIAGEISRGISSGQMYSEIARNVSGYARIPRNNAMRIARTEAHRIQCKASMDACFKAQDKGAEVMKQWDSALDAKTRPSHVKVDGEIRKLNEKFSNGLMYPGDPSGKAGEVINCRCSLNQRAKWALEANETKHLGNVKDMTDKQKENIAKKLNVPVDELEHYSDQIVPLNAKNYKEFKDRYNELWHYEGSKLQEEAEARIAGYKKKQASGGAKSVKTTLGNKEEKMYNGAKLSETTDKWAKEAKEELLLDEKSLSVRKKETACVYSGDGKFLFQKRGGENEVNFTVSEFKKLNGSVITHNHPTGSSFSTNDIILLQKSKASEIRVSTEECIYYIRQPQKWDEAINSAKKVEAERDKIKESVKGKYNQLYKEGKITKAERNRMASDEVNALFCERFGIEYGTEYFDD